MHRLSNSMHYIPRFTKDNPEFSITASVAELRLRQETNTLSPSGLRPLLSIYSLISSHVCMYALLIVKKCIAILLPEKKRTQTHQPKRSAPRSCYSGSRLRQSGASWTLFTVTICTTEGPLALEAGCWGIKESWRGNKRPIRCRWCSKKKE